MPTDIAIDLLAHIGLLQRVVEESSALVEEVAGCIAQRFESGNKLLLCGNGGSAADAQHIAAEFVNRFRYDRGALPAIALTTDSPVLTCIGNDASFASVFARQVEALARPGDVAVGISTSGRSANVLSALDAARAQGALAVGFTGAGGRKIMSPKCDYCVVVPSVDTARIQEVHMFLWHVICGLVESTLFPRPQTEVAETAGRS